MKIPNTTPASKFTQHEVSITRIKEEIKKTNCVRLYFIILFTFVCSIMEKYVSAWPFFSDLHFHPILEHKIGFPLC